MKYSIIFTTVIAVALSTQSVIAGEITYPDDSYTTGDPLTASDLNAKFNEIKADVNGNASDISTNSANININNNNISTNSVRIDNLEGSSSSGIATAESTAIPLSLGYKNIVSMTINAPSSGFVHVVATGMIQISGKTNSSSAEYASVYVGVTNTSNTSPLASNYTRFYRNGIDGTGSYSVPYSAQGVFQVSQGLNDFYTVAQENGGSGSGALYFNRIVATFHAAPM